MTDYVIYTPNTAAGATGSAGATGAIGPTGPAGATGVVGPIGTLPGITGAVYVTTGTSLIFGGQSGNVSPSGVIRFPNVNQTLLAGHNGLTGLSILAYNPAGPTINIGDINQMVQANTVLSAGGAVNFSFGGSTPLTISLASFQTSAPFAGSSFLGAPMRFTVGSQLLPTGSPTGTVLSASTASNPRLATTGVITANQDCILPTTSSAGGFYLVENQCTGAFNVNFKASGQTGVTIANGKKAIICMNTAGTDWTRFTPDT